MVSIITSVYGRKTYLCRLFDSLKYQTSDEFEWIIIDDGSEEELRDVIDRFLDEATFRIIYKKIKHGGKHRAINVALELSACESFIIVDSDDVLLDCMVEKMNRWWELIRNDLSYVGAAGLMKDFNNKMSGGQVDFDEHVDILWTERKKYGIRGESVYIFRKSYWMAFPFPEYENEDFLSEAVMMYRISQNGWKIKWFNEVVYQYEYLNDGLTKNIEKKYTQNPKGYARLLASMRNFEYKSWVKYMGRCRYYYEKCFDSINNDEIRRILGITTEEKNMIYYSINETIENIKNAVRNERVCSIYGWGVWGHIMQCYLKILKCEIEYIIDKNAKYIDDNDDRIVDYETIIPEDKLIFVCIKETGKNMKDDISRKFCNSRIIYMNSFYNDWDA